MPSARVFSDFAGMPLGRAHCLRRALCAPWYPCDWTTCSLSFSNPAHVSDLCQGSEHAISADFLGLCRHATRPCPLFETRALHAVVPMRLVYRLTEFQPSCPRFGSLLGVSTCHQRGFLSDFAGMPLSRAHCLRRALCAPWYSCDWTTSSLSFTFPAYVSNLCQGSEHAISARFLGLCRHATRPCPLFATRALRAVIPMRLDYELIESQLPCPRFTSLLGVETCYLHAFSRTLQACHSAMPIV